MLFRPISHPNPSLLPRGTAFISATSVKGESIATYVAELRRFVRHCNFGTNLHDCLRDRLVCGLSNTLITKKKCSRRRTSIFQAIQLATASETASRDAMELGKTPVSASVHKLSPTSSRRSSTISQSRAPARNPSPAVTEECFRCGRIGLHPQDCLCSDMECYACGKKGHISRACPRKNSDGANRGVTGHICSGCATDPEQRSFGRICSTCQVSG